MILLKHDCINERRIIMTKYKMICPGGGHFAKKEKLKELDFIRAVCAIGIIVFHISCYTSNNAVKILHTYPNGSFGPVIVSVFLLISGGVLYYNYSEITSLSQFYYKRWRTIFPMFYVAWLFYYMGNVLEAGTFFYKGKAWSLIFSVFALDGYLGYRFPTYYILGEWFLGGLVLLYLIYPILAKLVNRFSWKILVVLLPLWIWQLESGVFLIPERRNIIYIGGIFVVGMLIFKYELYKRKDIKFFCIIISIMLLFFRCSISSRYTMIVLGVTSFFALYAVGEVVMKIEKLRDVFSFLGGISFPFFLVQNKVGHAIVDRFVPETSTAVIKSIIVAVIMCIIYAWCVKAIANTIMQTNWFKKIDRVFLGDKST